LVKFKNVLSVDFISETFKDIGAFTVEHLNKMIKLLYNEEKDLYNIGKGLFPY